MSFIAKYRGSCDDCDGDIEPGDEIMYNETGEVEHVTCPVSKESLVPRGLCPKCFIELPVTRVCEECEG